MGGHDGCEGIRSACVGTCPDVSGLLLDSPSIAAHTRQRRSAARPLPAGTRQAGAKESPQRRLLDGPCCHPRRMGWSTAVSQPTLSSACSHATAPTAVSESDTFGRRVTGFLRRVRPATTCVYCGDVYE